MQIHELKPNHKLKKKKRIGRGGKRGTYSGKGIKGQSSRAGRKFQPIIRLLVKKYPKKRGYRFKSIQTKPEIINLSCLVKKFDEKSIISPEILVEKGLIRKQKGEIPKVKILGNGEIKKALIFQNCLVSEKAKEKIIKAKGTIKSKTKISNLKSNPKPKQ